MSYLLYILMVTFAILAVMTKYERRAVIYVGVFALAISLSFLFYSAPDVAIAQAVITSTLGTILYLIAIQKKKLVLIYYTNGHGKAINNDYKSKEDAEILKEIQDYCFHEGLESQVIYTDQTVETIKKKYGFDLIIKKEGKKIFIYGLRENELLNQCQVLMKGDKGRTISIYPLAEGDVE